jgi:hypothetical protein
MLFSVHLTGISVLNISALRFLSRSTYKMPLVIRAMVDKNGDNYLKSRLLLKYSSYIGIYILKCFWFYIRCSPFFHQMGDNKYIPLLVF